MTVVPDKAGNDNKSRSSLYAPDFVRKTQVVWGKIYGRELTEDEARDIITAYSEFSTCLKSIVTGGRYESVQDSHLRPS